MNLDLRRPVYKEEPERPAFVYGTREISRRAMFCKTAGVAAAVAGTDAPVAILSEDDEKFAAALFGVFSAGGTAFPLSRSLTRYEIAEFLKLSRAAVLLTSERFRAEAEAAAVLADAKVKILKIEDVAPKQDCPPQTTTREPLLLIATSGTTGNAKIVRLSARNVACSAAGYADKMDYDKFDRDEIRYVLGTPFTSAYGIMVLIVAAAKGFPVAIMKDAFSLPSLLKEIKRSKITHFEGGVAAALTLDGFSSKLDGESLAPMRYFGFAGSKITAATLRRLSEAFPKIEFWPGYGMTEAGPLIAKPDKRVRDDKLDAVGTAFSGEKIEIDADGKLTAEPFVTGEIVVEGENVTDGYLDNPAETEKLLRDGKLRTGDLGYLDDEGYLYVLGRIKNIVIVRGFNVHPEEVEGALIDGGLVKDCRVYGERDGEENERLCLEAVPASKEIGEAEIAEFCRERLAEYKRPYKIVLKNRIEKTETGKTVVRPR